MKPFGFRHPILLHRCIHDQICSPKWLTSRFLTRSSAPLFKFQPLSTRQSMDSDELFSYTSGSYNEELQRSKRYQLFDIEAMKRLAAESVNRELKDVVLFSKIAEGGFNRVFKIGLRDGSELIIRIPYPSTTPKLFNVASEVATMDFLRLYDIPVPKIHAYSVTTDNAAGVEYIVMEMLEGTPLGDRWYSMTEEETMKIIFQIARIEGRLFSIPFPASGSIYYSSDLEPSLHKIGLPHSKKPGRFCIGPSTNLKLWYGERSALSVNRGPFMSAESALKAGAYKELVYLQKYGKDRHIQNRLSREIFDYKKQSPLPYLKHLEDFLRIANCIAPVEDSFLNRPVIRHPDLNPNNIFVSESGNITGLIDWQHCSILPLFLHCGIPAYFQNYGDDQSEAIVKPELPKDFDSLTDGEKAAALEVFRKRQMHYYYLAATVKHNSIHFDALWEDFGMFKQRLFDHASSPWEGDNTTLMTDLIEATEMWSTIAVPGADGAPVHCPLVYSENDTAECLRIYHRLKEMDQQEEETKESLGVGHEGWVPNERYEACKELGAKMKACALDFAESAFERQMIDKHWMFDDEDDQE